MRRYSNVDAELHLREARRPLVGSGDSIKRTVAVAVPVPIEPADELSATMRSTVATLTPISRASSQRDT
ncbi:MAG TPA: hypothetical protein VGL57_14565 [Solirubrobacteraceae bacterium]